MATRRPHTRAGPPHSTPSVARSATHGVELRRGMAAIAPIAHHQARRHTGSARPTWRANPRARTPGIGRIAWQATTSVSAGRLGRVGDLVLTVLATGGGSTFFGKVAGRIGSHLGKLLTNSVPATPSADQQGDRRQPRRGLRSEPAGPKPDRGLPCRLGFCFRRDHCLGNRRVVTTFPGGRLQIAGLNELVEHRLQFSAVLGQRP